MSISYRSAPRAICYTPPHFADSLGTAAKCLQTNMGARKDCILRLGPRIGFSLPVHQSVHGAGTRVTACDASVTATKRPRCDAMLQRCCLCIAQNDATPS